MSRLASLTVAGVIAVTGMTALPAATAAPSRTVGTWTNCDHVHHRWPHGVGRRHAHDQTSGTPVTDFKRSNKLYRRAMNHNRSLDRDGDKIACEAR